MTEGFYTHFWESGLIDDDTEQKCLEQSNCKIMRETKNCIFVYDDYNLQKFWVNKSNCLKLDNNYLQEIYLHDTLKKHITKKDSYENKISIFESQPIKCKFIFVAFNKIEK